MPINLPPSSERQPLLSRHNTRTTANRRRAPHSRLTFCQNVALCWNHHTNHPQELFSIAIASMIGGGLFGGMAIAFLFGIGEIDSKNLTSYFLQEGLPIGAGMAMLIFFCLLFPYTRDIFTKNHTYNQRRGQSHSRERFRTPRGFFGRIATQRLHSPFRHTLGTIQEEAETRTNSANSRDEISLEVQNSNSAQTAATFSPA